MSNQQHSRCPRCGSRLFLESEVLGNRLLFFRECSLGCSRQWGLDGKPVRRNAGEHQAKIAGSMVPVG